MKYNINELEKLEKFSPDYNKNPLLSSGVEDMNSPVQDTFAAIALNRFGFAVDQVIEQKNYPYASQEAAVESILNMAFDDMSVVDFMAGIEADNPGILSRVWISIKNFFNRIFEFIFGKGSSDRTSIRYYAGVLKDKVAAMLGKGKQTPEEQNKSLENRVAILDKTRDIMDREKNTVDAEAVESESPNMVTSPVEAMELLNKITPQIHLVGQLIADAMSKSYTEASLNEKIVPRMNQIEKSYKEYESALKSISLSSISLDGLSKADLSKLYNQTTKFEMMWRQFESTRKLVNSINIEDMQRRMFSKDCINTLMGSLRKVQSGVLTIRSVVRALIGKISSGSESQDYYDDIFDLMCGTEAVDAGDVLRVIGVGAAIAGSGYLLYKIITKLSKWIAKKSTADFDKARKELNDSINKTIESVNESSRKLDQKIKEVTDEMGSANDVRDSFVKSFSETVQNKFSIIDYKMIYDNGIITQIAAVLLGTQQLLKNISKGEFQMIGTLAKHNNITEINRLFNQIKNSKKEYNASELINNQEFITNIGTQLEYVKKAFNDVSKEINMLKDVANSGWDKNVDMSSLSDEQKQKLETYIKAAPNEINNLIQIVIGIKNLVIESNKSLAGSIVAMHTTLLKNERRDISDILENEGKVESEELKELKLLIHQYIAACEAEEYFGLEAESKKPGLLKRIFNAILSFFKKVMSSMFRRGYRNKEVLIWSNTRVNPGYEDTEIEGITLETAKEYANYVEELTKTGEDIVEKLNVAFKKLVNLPNDYLGTQLLDTLKSINDFLEKTSKHITKRAILEPIPATQYLESMQLISKSKLKLLKTFDPDDIIDLRYPDSVSASINPKLMKDLQVQAGEFFAVSQKHTNYCEFIDNIYYSKSLTDTKLNGNRFSRIFGPIDRSKAKPSTESEYQITSGLDLLLSM